jgi:hypothetical protein
MRYRREKGFQVGEGVGTDNRLTLSFLEALQVLHAINVCAKTDLLTMQ